MLKYLGTHNSGTAYKLVWWQRLLSYPLQLVSQCQSRTIEEQLKDGIKLFNLQIAYYNGEFVFSHGLCIYDYPVDRALINIKNYATEKCPIYITLSLDKNFLLGQNKEMFYNYVEIVKDYCKRNPNLILLYATIEGNPTEWIYRNTNVVINSSEHYWTTSWSKTYGKKLMDKLPLPKRHAKIYNKEYIENNKADYLMLDFYNI